MPRRAAPSSPPPSAAAVGVPAKVCKVLDETVEPVKAMDQCVDYILDYQVGGWAGGRGWEGAVGWERRAAAGEGGLGGFSQESNTPLGLPWG